MDEDVVWHLVSFSRGHGEGGTEFFIFRLKVRLHVLKECSISTRVGVFTLDFYFGIRPGVVTQTLPHTPTDVLGCVGSRCSWVGDRDRDW